MNINIAGVEDDVLRSRYGGCHNLLSVSHNCQLSLDLCRPYLCALQLCVDTGHRRQGTLHVVPRAC